MKLDPAAIPRPLRSPTWELAVAMAVASTVLVAWGVLQPQPWREIAARVSERAEASPDFRSTSAGADVLDVVAPLFSEELTLTNFRESVERTLLPATRRARDRHALSCYGDDWGSMERRCDVRLGSGACAHTLHVSAVQDQTGRVTVRRARVTPRC